jgi:hypothetical protein
MWTSNHTIIIPPHQLDTIQHHRVRIIRPTGTIEPKFHDRLLPIRLDGLLDLVVPPVLNVILGRGVVGDAVEELMVKEVAEGAAAPCGGAFDVEEEGEVVGRRRGQAGDGLEQDGGARAAGVG